jgi:predicted transcriptional regulator
MIDGKPYQALTRHIRAHGLTPAEYRARYELPRTYPMVAPVFSEVRRATAIRIGLGDIAREARLRKAVAADPAEASGRDRPRADPDRRRRRRSEGE